MPTPVPGLIRNQSSRYTAAGVNRNAGPGLNRERGSGYTAAGFSANARPSLPKVLIYYLKCRKAPEPVSVGLSCTVTRLSLAARW
jgi:hypothetical protein